MLLLLYIYIYITICNYTEVYGRIAFRARSQAATRENQTAKLWQSMDGWLDGAARV